MKTFLALMLLATSASSYAGPRINWNYYDKPKKCWNECKREVFGQCIEWRERCDKRTANFTDLHKSIVNAAMNKLSNRLDSGSVASCIFDNRRRSYGVSANDAHLDFTAISRSSWLPRIHLHAYRENTNFSGQAYQKRVVKHVRGEYLEWSNEPHMDLNLSAMEISHHDLGFEAASDALAGTIIHEFLHQMGHGHPEGYNDGNYVTVVGDCIASNGAGARSGGFGLTGNIGRLFKYGPK